MKRRGGLSDEDKRLWAGVARMAVPLRGKPMPDWNELAPPPPAPLPAPAVAVLPRESGSAGPTGAPSAPEALRLHPIERPVRRKIGRGRVALDDRIDLHGLTEASAHGALLFFLRQAKARGFRHVLVITGRGASFGSTGSLKRAFPHWLGTPEFRTLVSGFEPAERGHGGEGAFYVRMRRA